MNVVGLCTLRLCKLLNFALVFIAAESIYVSDLPVCL